MPKRGENIYKRKDGRWEGRVSYPASSLKTRKYRSVYGKTYKEVREKLEEARKEVSHRQERCMIPVEEAANIWLSDKKDSWKEGTYGIYRQITEKYILPYFKGVFLCQVDSRFLEGFLAFVKEQKKDLSNTYLAYICGVVQRIVSHTGKKNGLCLPVPANPVPRERRRKVMFPEEPALAKLEGYLLKNVQDNTSLGILTALHTGLRIGELCALTWRDIDLTAGVIHVRGSLQRIKEDDGQKNKTKLLLSTPKTADSVRDIPIPPTLSHILKIHEKEPSFPLLAGVRGKWMEPRTLQYRFQKVLKDCGIDYFNFHMLRHAFATRCMELGFDIKSLSEIIGHSDIKVTLNLYVHSSLQQKKQLMGKLCPYSGNASPLAV